MTKLQNVFVVNMDTFQMTLKIKFIYYGLLE